MLTEEVQTCSLENLLLDSNFTSGYTNVNDRRDVDGFRKVDELKDYGFKIHVMKEMKASQPNVNSTGQNKNHPNPKVNDRASQFEATCTEAKPRSNLPSSAFVEGMLLLPSCTIGQYN